MITFVFYMAYWHPKNKELTKFRIHPLEYEYALKIHFYISKKKNKSLTGLSIYIREKTGGKFNRWFFYNLFKGKMIYIKFCIVLYMLDYCELNLQQLEQINVPDFYRRKFIK